MRALGGSRGEGGCSGKIRGISVGKGQEALARVETERGNGEGPGLGVEWSSVLLDERGASPVEFG
jgi:hypothetical protein